MWSFATASKTIRQTSVFLDGSMINNIFNLIIILSISEQVGGEK